MKVIGKSLYLLLCFSCAFLLNPGVDAKPRHTGMSPTSDDSFPAGAASGKIIPPVGSSKGETHKSKAMRKGELFNGKNLDGWYTYIKGRGKNKDPLKVFTVEDGMIRISGEEWGCITTNEAYENYKIVVEYKWGDETFAPRADKARDSGLLLHSTGEDGAYQGIWMRSIECQIIEGGTGDFIVIGGGSKDFSLTSPVAPEKQDGKHVFRPGGEPVTIHGGRINWYGRDPAWKDVKDFRGKNDVEKPVGKWNRLECIAKGGEIAVYLNGKLVNRAIRVTPTRGKIQIQSEAAEIFIRKIDLQPLSGD